VPVTSHYRPDLERLADRDQGRAADFLGLAGLELGDRRLRQAGRGGQLRLGELALLARVAQAQSEVAQRHAYMLAGK
jgi:hypothetical protein